MPETLKQFLDNLTDAQAKEVWEYLDANPDVINDMQEAIVDKVLR